MSVARTTEITSSSKKGFQEALEKGIARATKTLDNVSSAWVKDMEVTIKDNKISEYKVRMLVTFLLRD